MKKVTVLLLVLMFGSLAGLFSKPVEAQNFAGSNVDNYYCLPRNGTTPKVTVDDGDYVCDYDGDGKSDARAVPRPPSSRQLQYWFIRVLYIVWALAGIVFTLVLIGIGFQYLTSFGNEVALADVIKQFRKWLVGLGLVILAYPMLNTFFNVVGLRDSECLNDLQLPGFQFFFPTACVIEE